MKEVTKITEDELNSIQTIQNKYAEITARIGQLEVQKELLKRDIIQIEKLIEEQWSAYTVIQDTETKLGSSLKTKYGEGSLDITSGEFTPEKKSENN